jgi:OsmC subfamily peroxiredoxin
MSARRRLRQPSGIREIAVLVTNNLWNSALGVNRLNNNRRGGFMPIRKAEGNLVQASGRLKVGSGAFQGPYSFKSRLEEGQSATNPEELIGAAHAGCFTMALPAQLSQAGIVPNRVHTITNVKLDKVGEAFAITRVELQTEADIPKNCA